MAQQGESPFAGQPALEQGQEGVPDKVVEAVVDGDKPGGYKIVRTATGKNYVEADEYDPLEHHRSRDANANKGSGLGFMFCCCNPKTAEDVNRGAEP